MYNYKLINNLDHWIGKTRDVASFGLGGAMASPKLFFKNIILYIYMCVCTNFNNFVI